MRTQLDDHPRPQHVNQPEGERDMFDPRRARVTLGLPEHAAPKQQAQRVLRGTRQRGDTGPRHLEYFLIRARLAFDIPDLLRTPHRFSSRAAIARATIPEWERLIHAN